MKPVPSRRQRRRFLSWGVAAALAATLVSAPGDAAAAGTLLSQNRPVTVSST